MPSGLGYAVQNRRLTDAVLPELPRPDGLLDVEGAPAMLARGAARRRRCPPRRTTTRRWSLLSEGPRDSAWFEHRMLAEEMGVPVARDHRAPRRRRRGVTCCARAAGAAVDVLYLRIDEEALLHAAGADGRPLGAGAAPRRRRRPDRPGQRAGQRRRRRQGGVRVRATADRVLPGRAAAAGRRARRTCAPTRTSGATVLSGSTGSSSSRSTGTAARGSLIGPLATDARAGRDPAPAAAPRRTGGSPRR